jgi:regulatory protein
VEAGRALEVSLNALRHRDLSAADLDRRLAAKGFEEREREEALATLRRTGVLDDRRYSESRAASLAARGASDALIRHDLERAGVARELVDEAVEALDPEPDRARRIADRRGPGLRTARYLAGKGFPEETVAAVVATMGHGELG